MADIGTVSAEPLHAQVARALGWFGFEPSLNGMWPEEWRGSPPRPIIGEPLKEVPRYDAAWSATGPLIEKYGITLLRHEWAGPHKDGARHNPPYWQAVTGAYESYDGLCYNEDGDGRTPLEAVCALLLVLGAKGKL